jgi:hypothetical protein
MLMRSNIKFQKCLSFRKRVILLLKAVIQIFTMAGMLFLHWIVSRAHFSLHCVHP